jgi:hypothetical protein
MNEAPKLSNPTYVTIALLVLIAAAIHFFRASVDPDITVLFTLNGIGFLVLGAGVLFVASPTVRKWSRRILIAYAGVTALLYIFWAAWDGTWVIPWGPIATLSELVLIYLLFQVGREASSGGAGAS